jgi:uncharacterized protein
MKLKITSLFLVGSVLLFSFGCSKQRTLKQQPTEAPRTIEGKIGTGEQGGVYYTAGLALADLVNREQAGIQLTAEETSGAVFNINGLMIQALEFGFADEERQFQAVKGLDYWARMPQERLRFVCSLYPELVTVVVLDDSDIHSIADLKGKRVAIGSPGSGTQSTALDLLESSGLKSGVDYDGILGNSLDASQMLQQGKVDAFFYTVGHPNATIMAATDGEKRVRFLPIERTQELLRAHPYYDSGEIPVALYPSVANQENVPTVSLLTVLLTSAQVPDEVVYEITKILFENLEWYQKQQPLFANLKPQEMAKGGVAPTASGALRYYQEVGLTQL